MEFPNMDEFELAETVEVRFSVVGKKSEDEMVFFPGKITVDMLVRALSKDRIRGI